MTERTLITDRLILTPVTTADLDDLLALWSDTAFTRHIMGRALGAEEVWFRLLRDLGHWAALGHGNWTMRLKNSGDYVGSVGVFDYRRELDPPFNAPELGWGVAPAFQGRGFAAEAHLKSDATVCMISPDNAASVRLAERVGYTPYASALYNGSDVRLYRRPRAVGGG